MFKKAQLQLTFIYTALLICILIAVNAFVYFGLLSYNKVELANDMERIMSSISGTEWVKETEQEHIESDHVGEDESHDNEDVDEGEIMIGEFELESDVFSNSYELKFDDNMDLFIPERLNSFSYFFVYDEEDEVKRIKSANSKYLPFMLKKSQGIHVGQAPIAFDLGDLGFGNYVMAKFPIVIEGKTIATYTIVENVSIAYSTLSNLRIVMMNVMIVGSLISILIGYVLAGITIRPIKQAYLIKQRFVGDASHELRTPISIIMLSMETLKASYGDVDPQLNEVVDDVMEEAINMKELVKKLLFLARNDSGTVLFKSDVTNMTEVIQSNIKKYQQICMDKEITVKSNLKDDLRVHGDKKLLDSVVSILLDNAIKYNKANGVVEIEAKPISRRGKHYVEVTVTDTGIGIHKSDIDKIFERFYRNESSRSKQIEGYGLGLPIAKTVVESHGGTIKVESTEGIGTTFRFTIHM